MNCSYVLISFPKYVADVKVEKILTKLLKEDFNKISYENNVYYFSVSETDKDISTLRSSFDVIKIDLDVEAKVLVSPYASDKLVYYLDYIKDGSFEYLVNIAKDHHEIYEDALSVIENIRPSTMKTVLAYIENNSSPSYSSLVCYCHRNTVTYRVRSFEKDSGISLESFANKSFVYDLIRFHYVKVGEDSYMEGWQYD